MRYLLLLFFIGAFSYCNSQERRQAVFKECLTTPNPEDCTLARFKTDITSLIDKDIAEHIRETIKNYLTVKVIFVTDEQGDIVPDQTYIDCADELFTNAISKYLSTLPSLAPKDASQPVRRSVHVLGYVFAQNSSGYFYPLTKEEIKQRNIVLDHPPLDKYPVFPGCESYSNIDYSCMQQMVNKIIIQNFKHPNFKLTAPARFLIIFEIDTEGIITLKEIEGPQIPQKKAVVQALRKLPKVQPGEMRNIPYKTSFNLPVTINP